MTWQWQLSQLPTDLSAEAQVYDIDLFENDAHTIGSLHAMGRRAICYFSAGTWENWRPDAGEFPAEVRGKPDTGWPGERWLDVRRLDLLGPTLRARFDLCRDKGFDGVEADNVDGYANDSGFPVSAEDQLRFNRWLAAEAHARGLSIGLKNDPEQAAELASEFDWALTEDCFAEGWCGKMKPFTDRGKAVFAAEYTDTGVSLETFCPRAFGLGLSGILKHRDLGVWRQACPSTGT